MKSKLNYRLINIAIFIVLLIIIIVALDYIGFFGMVLKVLKALTPFYIGFFLSWLLLPFASFLQKKLKVNKTVANCIALLLSIILILVFLFILVPLAFIQASELFEKIPDVWQNVLNTLDKHFKFSSLSMPEIYAAMQKEIEHLGIKNLGQVLKSPISILQALMGVVITYIYSIVQVIGIFVAGYMIAFYFMGTLKSFVKAIVKLFAKENADKYDDLLVEISDSLYSYMKGMFIICLSVGLMTLIGASLIGVNSPFLFATISALFNVIPYLGPILGGIPLFFAALAIGPQQAFFAVLLVFAIQFFEAQIFQPKITAKTTDLHPVTIIVAMLIFATLFGFIGIVVAAPIMTIINVIVKHSSLNDKIKL